MIFDKLSNIKNYLGMNSNLDTAINYILEHDLNTLPMGKTELKGNQVYINVMEAQASPGDNRSYEIHKNYMDIQIDLEGVELIQTGDSAAMNIADYNTETDFGTVICENLADCIIGPGNFIICTAGEPHKPGCSVSENTFLKKCVFKVHI